MGMADVTMEKGCEVKDQDLDPQDCYAWVVDVDFEESDPKGEDIDSMVEFLNNVDDADRSKLD